VISYQLEQNLLSRHLHCVLLYKVQNKDVSKTETIKESEEIYTVNDMDGWMEVGPKNRTSTVRTVRT
jgi:hypothetical protein